MSPFGLGLQNSIVYKRCYTHQLTSNKVCLFNKSGVHLLHLKIKLNESNLDDKQKHYVNPYYVILYYNTHCNPAKIPI